VMAEPNGFYYMRARYYDPEVGRFVSEDPIGFEGGDVNLYAYVGGNPVLRVDPDGEIAAQIIGGVIGGIAGGYNAYRTGGEFVDIARSTLVGVGAGVLSTIPIPGINPLISGTLLGATSGFMGNLGSQLVNGTTLENLDYSSAGLSALAGGLGGFFGSSLAGVTTSRGAPIFTEYGQEIIGATFGGISAGILDATFHKP